MFSTIYSDEPEFAGADALPVTLTTAYEMGHNADGSVEITDGAGKSITMCNGSVIIVAPTPSADPVRGNDVYAQRILSHNVAAADCDIPVVVVAAPEKDW